MQVTDSQSLRVQIIPLRTVLNRAALRRCARVSMDGLGLVESRMQTCQISSLRSNVGSVIEESFRKQSPETFG
jgi:hypothetical protein